MKLSLLLENFDSFKELNKKLLEYQSDLIEEFDCSVKFIKNIKGYKFILSDIDNIDQTLNYQYRPELDKFILSKKPFLSIDKLIYYIKLDIGFALINKILSLNINYYTSSVQLSKVNKAKLIADMENFGYFSSNLEEAGLSGEGFIFEKDDLVITFQISDGSTYEVGYII